MTGPLSPTYITGLILQTLDFAVPVLITIFIGLFFAGMLMETGVLSKMGSISRPLVRFAHLPPVCASSFVVSIGSTVAANSMVASFKDEEIMGDRAVFLCALANSIPAYIREIFTYQIPIVVPALGLAAGGLYAMVFMVTAIAKISVVIIGGRLLLEERSVPAAERSSAAKVPLSTAARRAVRRQTRLFLRISTIYLVVTFMVFLLKDMGAFDLLDVRPFAALFGVPPESLVPLTSYVISPILGLTMLGPMIGSGEITEIQAMIVLMLGSMFMLPVFAARSLLPNYTAIFGPRLGGKIVAVSTGISVVVRFIFLLIFMRLA